MTPSQFLVYYFHIFPKHYKGSKITRFWPKITEKSPLKKFSRKQIAYKTKICLLIQYYTIKNGSKGR